jgi:phage terminase large subunit GpA-like protein
MQPQPKQNRIALRLVMGALVAGLALDPVTTVSAWAQANRWVASEASPRAGKWDNATAPYLVEVMDCLSFVDPCREVTVQKSAQLGFTEVINNWFGYIADAAPAPMMIVQPTTQALHSYTREKLELAIEATPALRRKVVEQKSRDEAGSTTRTKRFPGGFCTLALATSSADLQSKTIRALALDEVSEYPAEAGERGDPVDQAIKRTLAFSENRKIAKISTPALVGACRVSADYEKSDKRRYYVPCPQCDAFQVLLWENFVHDRRPAFFVCQANGCAIAHHHKARMLRDGVWLKTFDGGESDPPPPHVLAREAVPSWRARASAGREPGFAIWQAYSPFVPWDDTAADYEAARNDPKKLKTFTQQALGEPWKEAVDVPPAEKLFEARGGFARGRVPTGALFLTGFVDVQKDRLEWGVYAWGPTLRPTDTPEAWLVDFGVIAQAPESADAWLELDAVVDRTFPDAWDKNWDVDACGVDAGYLTNRVYQYALRRALPRAAIEPHNPATTRRVFAVDGRPGWKNPPLWLAKASVSVDFKGRKIGAIQLWASGTWDMKSDHYQALRQMLAGPDEATGHARAGTLHLGQFVDRDYLAQLTAEHLADSKTTPPRKIWLCPKGARNEALDIAVGARALAAHLSANLAPADWQALAARRYGDAAKAQGDLAELWSPDLANAVRGPSVRAGAIRRGPLAEPAAPKARGLRGGVSA